MLFCCCCFWMTWNCLAKSRCAYDESVNFTWHFIRRKNFHFFLALGVADWKTLLAAIRFSMYWPSTWFSDFSFRFSTLTESTRDDRSVENQHARELTSNQKMSHKHNNKDLTLTWQACKFKVHKLHQRYSCNVEVNKPRSSCLPLEIFSLPKGALNSTPNSYHQLENQQEGS